jgi:hypothetical protein
MALQLVTNMTVYADFYATIQFLEAAKNRVINACRSVSRARMRPEQEAEIINMTCQIYNHMFNKGKAAVQQLENHLQAARRAALAKDAATQAKEAAAAVEWCRAVTATNRAIYKVVIEFCAFLTQHNPNNDSGITPSIDPAQKLDMSGFINQLKDVWALVS